MTEFRPGRFQILPTIIKNIIIINVLIFIAQVTVGKNTNFFEDTFALHTWQSPLFQPWQLITHMFLHGGIDHIFFNMFALWMFGSILENLWGPKKFLIFYIVCGLGAALCHLLVLYFETQNMISQFNAINSVATLESFISKYGQSQTGTLSVSPAAANDALITNLNEPTLGASGAIFGCLAAFGYLFPNTYIYLYFFLPIKAKWFVIGYIAVELFSTFQNSAGDNIAHVAHLGGALVGLILVYFWNKKNRRTFY
ncbi:MAG: rhomboid family intramembrane serine protease [Chitinophagaceae bacterium]